MRKLLAGIMLASTLVPLVGHADEVPIVAEGCESKLILFTRRTVLDPATGEPVMNPATGAPVRNSTYDTQSAGCTANEQVAELEGAANSAYIYPFANSFAVRSLAEAGVPISGTVEFAGTTYQLDLKPGATITGETTVYDSQDFYFPEGLGLTGGDAVVTVVFEGGDNDYAHRVVYSTLG